MEGLFSNNLFAIYIVACIAVMTYTDFEENQRMFILYLFTYATAFFEVFSVPAGIFLLLLITFVFLEYLTDDTKKLSLITGVAYKTCDYLFMMIFQYHFIWIFAAFGALYCSRSDWLAPSLQFFVKAASVLPLFYGAHQTISQPFKIKSITEICRVFEQYPPYMFHYKPAMQEKFDLLCAFEDKTYFQRKNSYSCISLEYIVCFLKSRGLPSRKAIGEALSGISSPSKLWRSVARIFRRGYSTPEMQLLRTIGIQRGYEQYKIRRKIFEVVYSKIVFSSLKKYHLSNTYSSLEYYRHYLLYVYFRTVLTKINGVDCRPFCAAFENGDDFCSWSMDGLFVACLGLSFRKADDKNLRRYAWVIDDFHLDVDCIRRLSNGYPDAKLPSANALEAAGL